MKNYVLRQFEAGKKIKGLEGWIAVAPTAECGSKSEGKFYIPIKITKVDTQDCGKLRLYVEPTIESFFGSAGNELILPPTAIYQSVEEIEKTERN